MAAGNKIVYKYTPRIYRLLDRAVEFRQTKYGGPILYTPAYVLTALTAVICFKDWMNAKKH